MHPFGMGLLSNLPSRSPIVQALLGEFGNVAADFHQAAVHRFLFAFGSRQDFGFDLFQDSIEIQPVGVAFENPGN